MRKTDLSVKQRAIIVHGHRGGNSRAASRIKVHDIPETFASRLPRYAAVPVVRIGRLAVDQPYRGRKLGAALLWDAVTRALRSEAAVFALIVDAKDESSEAFYRHHGFVNFGSLTRQLVLPLSDEIVGNAAK